MFTAKQVIIAFLLAAAASFLLPSGTHDYVFVGTFIGVIILYFCWVRILLPFVKPPVKRVKRARK